MLDSLIFETVHGSHLYGLAHEDSDRDVFFVTDSKRRRSRHSYNGALGLDQVRVGLTTFLRHASEGSHQHVEALFSPYKHWYQSEYREMIESYRVTGPEVFAKYERTIKSFCYGDLKRRRHACRLSLNLAGLRKEGRFNPVMTDVEIFFCNKFAANLEGDKLVGALLARRLTTAHT